MKPHYRNNSFGWTTFLFWFLVLVLAAGCAQTTAEPAADLATPTLPDGGAPAAVVAARESALTFLRTSANECVPRAGVSWQLADIGAEAPAGFGVYRFTAGDCIITVSYLLNSDTDLLYHVALGDSVTGFCWQAVVDTAGHVVMTGAEAISQTDQRNPSAIYCTEQGYTYLVQPQENGVLCGMCVFPDGRACKSWSFFNGQCTLEDAIPLEE